MSFTVYKSSAGSGKTFTLVKEYLCMVLKQPTSFRNILAITFTNKAANELKERVLTYLKELSSEAAVESSSVKKFMLPILLEETNLDEKTIKERAGTTLSLILHNYSDFAIGTIDSFVHRIIKTFAYDLKLPLSFDVELDDDEHLNRAIDVLISRIGIDPDLTNILINFTKLKTSEEVDWQIEKDLLKFSKTLINEDGGEAIDKIKILSSADFKEIAQKTSNFIREFKGQIVPLAQSAVDLIKSKNISDKTFYYGAKGISVYFKKLSQSRNEDFNSNSFVKKTIEEDIWYTKKVDVDEIVLIDSIKDELKKYYLQIAEILEQNLKRFHLYRIIHKQIYAVAVLGEIGKIIEEQKHVNNIIHISEFNKRVADIVFNEPVPFIYERLGERYKSFLIDEFQDTSVLQWQNFIPLIDNSLAEGNFNMIVGDGKQAIYRFRNGEVEQFAKLPDLFQAQNLPLAKEREQTLKRNFVEKHLKRNYRSKREIIEFNNQFFKVISEKLAEDFQSIYHGLVQEFDENNKGGYVQINLLEAAKGEDQTWTDLNLLKVKDTIDELITDQFLFKDITVLCRSNAEITCVASYLLENDYPIITNESLVLSSSAEVRFIIAVLNFLIKPSEKLYKASILKYLVEANCVKDSFEEALNCIQSVNDENENTIPKADPFLNYLELNSYQINSTYLLTLPIYDLVEELIRIFKFDKDVNPFIQFFLDAVMKCNAKEQADVFGFLEWWERNQTKESVIIPDGLNAIQILSIHKSKGLEFPVVIYPFANNVVKNSISHSWIDLEDEYLPKLKSFYLPLTKKEAESTDYAEVFHKETDKSLLDLLNILYVAFTRPTERLYVISEKIGKSKASSESVSRLIQFFLQQSGVFEEDKMEYAFGNRMAKNKIIEESSEDSVALKTFISQNWRQKLLISTNAPEIWDIENPEKNKEWGNLIHLILSKIQFKEDAKDVVSRLVESGIIRTEELKEVLKVIDKLMNHEQVGKFFAAGLTVKNEAEMLMADGHAQRPDRLIFSKDALIIIDYKTGKPESKHEKQIIGYANNLASMGYKNIQKYLIYLNENIQVIEVA